MTYEEFLRTKRVVAPDAGFDVPEEEISQALKPHQRDAVRWACLLYTSLRQPRGLQGAGRHPGPGLKPILKLTLKPI